MSGTQKKREVERRFIPAEMRMDGEGRIEGYAAVFDTWAEIWGFREQIRQGAFSKTIREADVRCLFNHDPNYVLGRNRANTLELSEDTHGLHFRVSPPDAAWASDLHKSIARGDIDQASFSFWTVRDEWHDVENVRERTLLEVGLYDVSPVTFPAYPETKINARSLMQQFISRVGDDSPELVDEMMEQLRALSPSQVGHDDAAGDVGGVQVSLDVMRQRLRLLELAS